MTEASDDATQAPEIPGYTYVRPVGHGGFSDVYLYEQQMPRRDVAIKVLRTDDLSQSTREQFAAEANLMARVSNHSNIAAIYAADVDDDGQPYLVMEFCSGGSLGSVYRKQPLSVPDVLSLGIRLSGALEAAHRSGIVHRDIKPANILLTEYGVPVLSDFGISTIDEDLPESTRRPHRTHDANGAPGTGESSVGMSLPWAAPETLWDEPVSDARSDRYSFAATLYSLIEGRSPHEVVGGPNSAAHLSGRIATGFVGSIRRTDVPDSLKEFLRRGLAHDRAARYPSTASMGRALQAIQRELGLEVTPLELPRGVQEDLPEPSEPPVIQAPLDLPAGHQTLAPLDLSVDGSVPGGSVPSGSAPGGSGPGVASQLPAPVLASAPLPSGGTHSQPQQFGAFSNPQQPAFATPSPSTWVPQQQWDGNSPTSTDRLAPRTKQMPSAWREWRQAIFVFIAVLAVACLVVGIMLVRQSMTAPPFNGREIDNLEVSLNTGGAYNLDIPTQVPVPADAQFRMLQDGDGDTIGTPAEISISLDSGEWVSGESLVLNPLESTNQGNSLSVTVADFNELGIDVAQMHGGDVLLVAAPSGWFANLHPAFGLTSSDANLVLIQINGPA